MPTATFSTAERSAGWLFLATLTSVLVFGGGSRADALSQPVVRLISLAAIAAVMVLRGMLRTRSIRLPLTFFGAISASIALQLIPLPSNVWRRLPPRDALIPALQDIGLADIARPLSLNPDGTINALLALLPPVAVLLTAAIAPPSAHRRAVAVVLTFAFTSAVLGLLQAYTGSPYFYRITNSTSAVGLFANRNHFALLLAVSLPFIAVWARRREGSPDAVRFRRWVGLCGAIAAFPLLLATGSRAGLILGITGEAIALLIVRQELVKAIASRSGALWVAIPMAVGIAATALLLVMSRAQSVTRLFDEEGSELRVTMFPYVLAMVRDSFPWGVGAGAFPAVFKFYEPQEALTRFYLNHAHNDPLEVVAELGLPGAILIAAFLVWAAVRATSIWRHRERRSGADLARLGTAVVLLTIMASAVDYPLRTGSIGGLFVLACCWMMRHWHEPVERAGEAPSSTRTPDFRHRHNEGFAGAEGGRS